MSWATHVKIQNLGLADTCSPSEKKMIPDARANWIKEGAGGTTEEAHQERYFFLQWMALDGVFLLASAPYNLYF